MKLFKFKPTLIPMVCDVCLPCIKWGEVDMLIEVTEWMEAAAGECVVCGDSGFDIITDGPIEDLFK